MPKVVIELLLTSYLLPESFMLANARILLFDFIAVVNPFNPYTHLASLRTFIEQTYL